MNKRNSKWNRMAAAIAFAALLMGTTNVYAGSVESTVNKTSDSVAYSDKIADGLKARLDMISDEDFVDTNIEVRLQVPQAEINRMIQEETGIDPEARDVIDRLQTEEALQYWDTVHTIERREKTKLVKDFMSDNLIPENEFEYYSFYENTDSVTVGIYLKKSSLMKLMQDERVEGARLGLNAADPREIRNVIPDANGEYLDSQIRADYINLLKANHPQDSAIQRLSEWDAVIQKYYGSYHGYEIVIMDLYCGEDTDEIGRLQIGDYVFEFSTGGQPYRFYAWKDGEFTLVKDAYAAGQLTDEDIAKLYGIHHPQRWNNPFTDISESAWYYDSIKFAHKNALMVGRGQNLFDPEGTMTRAMAVTTLWRYAGELEGYTNRFSDVAEGTWYTQAVAWAAGEGIVQGVGDGRFAPEEKITREQLFTILFRLAKYRGVVTDYSSPLGILSKYEDKEKVSDWAEDAMGWAINYGVVNGITNEKGFVFLEPAGQATRAQMATILMRYIQSVDNK